MDGKRVRATTFGIEFEFILAFEEGILESVISEYSMDATIRKDLTEYQHRSLLGTFARHPIENPAYARRLRYPSWVLHVPEDDVVCRSGLHRDMFVNSVSQGKQWLRRYVMEPILVAKRCLEAVGLSCNAIGWVEPDPHCLNDAEKARIPYARKVRDILVRSRIVDHTQWTVTNDHTLVGALWSQLSIRLKSRGVSAEHLSHWDRAGIELLSPIFELEEKTEAFRQIERYMNALNAERVCMLESVWAGTHVHIGFDFERPEDMPMLLLQHRAYILILHEDLLSRCHPKSRSGVECPRGVPAEAGGATLDDEEFDEEEPFTESVPTPTGEELSMENERIVLAAEAEYTGADNVAFNARYLRSQLQPQSPQGLSDAIQDAIFKENGDIFDLVKLMQRPKDPSNPEGHRHRGYMYNFANLWTLAKKDTTWKPIKPTVEFRQHACTMDVAVVKLWVTLLEAIVRTAEKKAASNVPGDVVSSANNARTFADREGNKYPSGAPSGSMWPCTSMREFCMTFLGLDEDDAGYWEGRFELYKNDRPSEDVPQV